MIWDNAAATGMRHSWLSDGLSLSHYFPTECCNKVNDKQIAMELWSLRQLFSKRDGVIRWLDTSKTVMLVDCLTKAMKLNLLETVLISNHLDMIPNEDSLRRKPWLGAG